MTYNFDKRIDRTNTNALKMEGYKGYIFHADDSFKLPFADDEFIHLWVADMEFATPIEIRDAIKERLDKEILGYTGNMDDRLYDAFRSWCKDRYDFTFNKEELVISKGVVPALINIIGYVLEDDEKVLFNTPAYGQFANACRMNEKDFVTSPLIKNEDGSYDLDFDDLDEKMARDDVKIFILCNPHNPTGRAWSEEELNKLAELIEKHDVWLISDEIHCDLRRKDAKGHIPVAKVMPNYDKLITCMAASKTFNIAGLQQSNILIRNEELRKTWLHYNKTNVNPLSHEATIAAYSKCDKWLEELTLYLDGNFKFLDEFIKENLPEAILTPAETTYLAWVDFKNYFEEDEDLELFFAEKAGVLVEGEKAFVDDANRMIRLNLACPRDYLKEGLERMADAIKNNHDDKFIGGVSGSAL